MRFVTGLEAASGGGPRPPRAMTLKVFSGAEAFVCFAERRRDRIDRGESKQSPRIKLLKVLGEKGGD